jgi:protein-tyrosine phosphatase
LDGEGNDPAIIRLALQTCLQLLQANKRTLIACSAGMSRSPTLAAFVLAELQQRQPEDFVKGFSKQKSLEIKPTLWHEIASARAAY